VRLLDQSASSPRVKGVGESATVGVPPAAVRSVEKILGRRLRTTPLNPSDMLDARV
jgi:CO/xanthine dehydrogenase Mo-binding subunit